ncbi:MAG: hypothetical protein NTY34_03625 [Candidatus Omnitrophica bacterium]|nr:hypothetical protein [Candidatus Omnitrophota bacterium]
MINKSISGIVPMVVVLIAIWAILMIPFKIIGYGFLPPDDALWHSAKVISGKNWSEVLVLRDGIKMESHPGWHYILSFVHKITSWDVHSLVLFSVISLFILFFSIPVFFLRYPESWLLSILTLSIATPGWFFRMLLGRPYIVTMAVLLFIFMLWPRLKGKKIAYASLITITVLIAVSTWIHRTFYILLIPIAAFLLAREWKASIYMIICSIAGIFIGAALTGHPILFIKQTMLHLIFISASYETQDTLVTELRPALGDFAIVIIVALFLFWRALRGRWNKNVVDNPIFILGALSFIGGFITRRIWLDVGMVAVILWMTIEFEDFLSRIIKIESSRRLLSVLALAGILYLSLTADVGARWTNCRPQDYLSSEDPAQAEWMPDPGGIIYSDDMMIFFQTVFKNPNGNWRYILGSESAIMPQEDLDILRNIQKNRWSYVPFEPWVKKMRIEDRLIIRGEEDRKPKLSELEWNYAARSTWIGRKPKHATK